MKPRVRSGYALKRLDASEGSKRWILKDLNRNTFLRLSDNDARLFELIDGSHSLSDLIGDRRAAPRRGGRAAAGAAARRPRRARLPRRRGGRGAEEEAPKGFLRRLFKPREKTIAGLGGFFDGALPARRLGALHAARRCTRSRC